MITAATLPGRVLRMVFATVGHLVPWSYAGMSFASTAIGCISILFLLWMLRTRREPAFQNPREASALALVWAPGLLGLVVTYVVFFNATHFYGAPSFPGDTHAFGS